MIPFVVPAIATKVIIAALIGLDKLLEDSLLGSKPNPPCLIVISFVPITALGYSGFNVKNN